MRPSSWSQMRSSERSPIHGCHPEGYAPFWAVTKHADICDISKRPDDFLNAPGIVHPRTEIEISRDQGIGAMRTIIEMDPPQHRSFRKVASPWFTPRALARVDAAVDQSARDLVDGVRAAHRASGLEIFLHGFPSLLAHDAGLGGARQRAENLYEPPHLAPREAVCGLRDRHDIRVPVVAATDQ